MKYSLINWFSSFQYNINTFRELFINNYKTFNIIYLQKWSLMNAALHDDIRAMKACLKSSPLVVYGLSIICIISTSLYNLFVTCLIKVF